MSAALRIASQAISVSTPVSVVMIALPSLTSLMLAWGQEWKPRE